jgi:hypothetical protein
MNRVLIGVIIAHILLIILIITLRKEYFIINIMGGFIIAILNFLFTGILVLVTSYYCEMNHIEWFKKYPVVKTEQIQV